MYNYNCPEGQQTKYFLLEVRACSHAEPMAEQRKCTLKIEHFVVPVYIGENHTQRQALWVQSYPPGFAFRARGVECRFFESKWGKKCGYKPGVAIPENLGVERSEHTCRRKRLAFP